MNNSDRIAWFVVGALVAVVVVEWSKITWYWQNQDTINAAAQVVNGLQQTGVIK